MPRPRMNPIDIVRQNLYKFFRDKIIEEKKFCFEIDRQILLDMFGLDKPDYLDCYLQRISKQTVASPVSGDLEWIMASFNRAGEYTYKKYPILKKIKDIVGKIQQQEQQAQLSPEGGTYIFKHQLAFALSRHREVYVVQLLCSHCFRAIRYVPKQKNFSVFVQCWTKGCNKKNYMFSYIGRVNQTICHDCENRSGAMNRGGKCRVNKDGSVALKHEMVGCLEKLAGKVNCSYYTKKETT